MEPYRHAMSHCRAGVARRDITPPAGIYNRNWGAALHDTALGVHRPFTATALCLDTLAGERLHALVALDLGWFGRDEDRELRDALCAALGIDESQLLVMLSHTHAGPNLATTRVEAPGGALLRPYFDQVISAAREALLEARDSMVEAWVTFGAGSCHLATNRDTWDEASDQWVCGFNPAGTADSTLVVGRITTAAGAPLATIVNYGCHPTTLGPENRLLSPDYIGAMREIVEQHEGAPALFMLGACGETGPREGFVADPAVADRNGRVLGHAAASTLDQLPLAGTEYAYTGPLLSGATLGIWQDRPLAPHLARTAESLRSTMLTVPLPLKPRESLEALQERYGVIEHELEAARQQGDRDAERDATARLERTRRRIQGTRALPAGDTVSVPLWIWQLGHAFVVAVPAEPYSLLQTALRERFPGHMILVSVVTNGGVSYLLPRDQYGSGLYQDVVAVVGAGGLEQMIDQAAPQIGEWLGAGA